MSARGEERVGPPGDDSPALGLSALHAALAHAVERHGLDTFAIAVDDPDLGRQAFAAGAAAGTALALLAAEPDRQWWASPALAEAPAELDALQGLARTALLLGRADPAADPGSALEVLVRGLPHVVTVLRRGPVVEVTVAPGRRDDVVARLASGPPTGPGIAIVHEGTATPVSAPGEGEWFRAELLTVRSLPETGELEVHLRTGDRRTVGRGPLNRAGSAAAAATLDALDALAAADPADTGSGGRRRWRVGWVRTIDTMPDREFLVAVTIRRDQGANLYGLATGTSPIEAAARATLHACNRVAGWSPPD